MDMVVMLLDFEKAYDRISREFLKVVMEALGFEGQWILGMVSFHKDASN